MWHFFWNGYITKGFFMFRRDDRASIEVMWQGCAEIKWPLIDIE
jgi:hypothetical protein